MKKLLLISSLISSALILSGCGDERKKSVTSSDELTVQQPAQIVNESQENYDDNINGLITHKTLSKWLENWEANRPAGVTGKLIILQQAEGPEGAKFIKPNNKSTFTYVENGWLESRSNGLAYIPSIIISGPTVDSLVKRYGIDLENDMIVCAQGAGSTGVYMNQGRCWFTFSYWGVDQSRIAVLNGNNQYLQSQGFTYLSDDTVDTKNPSPIIGKQLSSVKDLKVDNTALYASIEDVINALPNDDLPTNNGTMLWDARSLPQYSAGLAKWVDDAVEVGENFLASSFQNQAPRQSHPRGAINLEFTNLMDVPNGLYLSKPELADILDGKNTPNGQSFVSGGLNYQPLGAGNAYHEGDTIIHYCETSMRAAITIVATGVILGIPSRLYDSAMIEWNSLTASTKDNKGKSILPANSPWDTEFLSAPIGAHGDTLGATIDPRSAEGWAEKLGNDTTAADVVAGLLGSPLIVDPFAEHVDQVTNEDKAYKLPPKTQAGSDSNTDEKPSSGGFAPPANACGG